MLKFRVGDRVLVKKGNYKGLRDNILAFDKNKNHVFLPVTGRFLPKKGFKYKPIHLSNLRHLDDKGNKTKIGKIGKGKRSFRIYRSNLNIVRGDVSALIAS